MGAPPPRLISYDEPLWVEIDGYEGRWFIEGNVHLRRGRIRASRPGRRIRPTFQKSEVTAASPEARIWIDGFLAGSEPTLYDMFGDSEIATDDPRHQRWEAAVAAYRQEGWWSLPDWCHLIDLPAGLDLSTFVWAQRADEVWVWGGSS